MQPQPTHSEEDNKKMLLLMMIMMMMTKKDDHDNEKKKNKSKNKEKFSQRALAVEHVSIRHQHYKRRENTCVRSVAGTTPCMLVSLRTAFTSVFDMCAVYVTILITNTMDM